MAKGIGCHMLTIEDWLRNDIAVRDKKSLTCSLLKVLFVCMLCVFVSRGGVGHGGRGVGNGWIQYDALNISYVIKTKYNVYFNSEPIKIVALCYGQTLPNRPSLIYVCIHLHQYLLCGYLIKGNWCHIVHLKISNSLVF